MAQAAGSQAPRRGKCGTVDGGMWRNVGIEGQAGEPGEAGAGFVYTDPTRASVRSLVGSKVGDSRLEAGRDSSKFFGNGSLMGRWDES